MSRKHLGYAALVSLCIGAAAPGAIAAQQKAPKLNDAQIAHIAVTANSIDVEAGQLARERGKDERVRAFANRMITDHTAVNEQAVALATRLGVTPEDNDVSRGLRKGAAAASQSLERTSATGFDRAYMTREVDYHRAVLQALDETLIPSAQNAELKKLLEQARGAVAAHLTHAEELREALGS